MSNEVPKPSPNPEPLSPRLKAALDEGLADLAAGRTRVFKSGEFEAWIRGSTEEPSIESAPQE